MAVVINEVEVVEQPAGRAEPNASAAAAESKPEQPAPEEVAQAVAQQIERYERVRAH
ncbi:MAG TPA: hypothetical protein VF525_14835 [Pyrinomonadaceae bacterium]|jgi:hypothetical protein